MPNLIIIFATLNIIVLTHASSTGTTEELYEEKYKSGVELLKTKDIKKCTESLNLLKQSAKHGYAKAQYKLGIISLGKTHCANRNIKHAIYWLNLAKDNNYNRAAVTLFNLYSYHFDEIDINEKSRQDTLKSLFPALLSSANNNFAPAQALLAEIYLMSSNEKPNFNHHYFTIGNPYNLDLSNKYQNALKLHLSAASKNYKFSINRILGQMEYECPYNGGWISRLNSESKIKLFAWVESLADSGDLRTKRLLKKINKYDCFNRDDRINKE